MLLGAIQEVYVIGERRIPLYVSLLLLELGSRVGSLVVFYMTSS